MDCYNQPDGAAGPPKTPELKSSHRAKAKNAAAPWGAHMQSPLPTLSPGLFSPGVMGSPTFMAGSSAKLPMTFSMEPDIFNDLTSELGNDLMAVRSKRHPSLALSHHTIPTPALAGMGDLLCGLGRGQSVPGRSWIAVERFAVNDPCS